jgi:hypothetical protein
MSALREAAQQALEALENTTPTGFNMERDKQFFAAITALRAALAQQEQEPVAWQWLNSAYFRKKPPANAESGAWNPLYTTPPRREWQSLTEEEILLTSVEFAASHQQDDVAFARAIEAKLKEKNNG